MKIFKCRDIKKIDEYTITHEPVASADLMERAAGKIRDWYIRNISSLRPVYIFCGPGNNGGDGLALARMLAEKDFRVGAFDVRTGSGQTDDRKLNLERLLSPGKVAVSEIDKISQFPSVEPDAVIVDAIFGSGLSRPSEGIANDIIRAINHTGCTVVSVDIPSGLFGEDNGSNNPEGIIRATYTLTFQFPRLSFMFPENEEFTGKWIVLPIGLHQEAINSTATNWQYTYAEDITPLLVKRNRFDHKGAFGHCLMIAGSYGKMGAALLSCRAALKTGAGLLTAMIPSSGNIIMQVSLPEAMLSFSDSDKIISGQPDTGKFSAVGIGPGIGTSAETAQFLLQLMKETRKPLVIDADGLNILSENKEWLELLPENTILTPHPREFERLAGKSNNSFRRLELQLEFCKRYRCIVALKGANTSVADATGNVFFNSTGNPGMATAGSGDALTGVILSLLAQGYSPIDAARTGVFIHGLAGDIALEKGSQESLIASDIIDNIGEAFNRTGNKLK